MSEDAKKLRERIKRLKELYERGEISDQAYDRLLREYLEKLRYEEAPRKPSIKYSYVATIILLIAGILFGYMIRPPEIETVTLTFTRSILTTMKIDNVPPSTGSEGVRINGGAEYTNSSQVKVNFAAWDPISGLKRIYLSNDAIRWRLVEEYNPPTKDYVRKTLSWKLSPGDGNKCVYLELEDGLGNKWWPNPPQQALPYLYDCIKLDTTPPPPPNPLPSAGGNRFMKNQVTLEWRSVSDPPPGQIDHYIVEVDNTPSFNSPNKKTYITASTSKITEPLNLGTWYWRVRAVDKAGNRGPWSEIASFTIVKGAEIYAVIRGTNNRIYYRSYSNGSWGSWKMLPGSTIDSPAAVECGGRLHIVARGNSNTLWYGYVNLSTGNFSGWKRLSGATPSRPDLAATADCKLYLAIRGMDDQIYLNYHNGSTWVGWRRIPGSTLDGPAIAVLGNSLHVIIRGSDGLSLWHGIMDLSTNTWWRWIKISGSTPSTPDLAADQATGTLYLAVRGKNNRIYVRSWFNGSWGDWEQVPTGTTSDGPAIRVSGRELHIMVRRTSPPNSIYHCIKKLPAGAWSSWKKLNGATLTSPTLT
mgnify:CR=1 FL=1